MRRTILTLSLLLVQAMLPVASQAATYYVSPQGSDTAPCSAPAPCQTINAGIQRLQGGDTLVIGSGTYHETILAIPSGTAGAPTVIHAAPGATVWLQPTSEVDCALHFGGSTRHVTIERINIDTNHQGPFGVCTDPQTHHIILRHFEIKNATGSGGLTMGNYLEMRNLHIHHNGRDPLYDHGIYQQASNSIFDSNTIHDNQGYRLHNYPQC